MTTAANTTPPVRHQNPPLDDEDFLMTQKWEGIKTILDILYDLNVAMAVILGLIGTLLFLTIVNKKMRTSSSPVWYMYHLIALTTVIALLVHTFFHSGILFNNRGLCFFVMYTSEFIFFAIGVNMVLLNVEIYFTTVLPLSQWQWSPFMRFVICILSSWIGVLVTSIYIVVNNNAGLKNSYHCFYMQDETPRVLRMVFRSAVPAVLCFIATIVLIGTHCLKRSRFRMTSASGELREVRISTNEGEMEWTRVAVYVNIVFIVRVLLVVIVTYSQLWMKMDDYIVYMVLLVAHATTLYMLPLGMFFVSDARATIKALIFKAISLASCGKLRLGEDLEQLSVSFGHDSGANLH